LGNSLLPNFKFQDWLEKIDVARQGRKNHIVVFTVFEDFGFRYLGREEKKRKG
jgi:hypothetical protein